MSQSIRKEDQHHGREEEIQRRIPEEDVSPRTLRSTTPVFDITSHCLFCSENIPTSDRLTSKRRKLISNVETTEFKDSVLKCARERCDEWGNLVAKRIESAIDLVAAEAKYHCRCAQEFFQCRGENTVGKPADAAREHAFSELCNFLDETDECQYSLSELLELMETVLMVKMDILCNTS